MALELELCSVDGARALKSRRGFLYPPSCLWVGVSTLAYEENFSSVCSFMRADCGAVVGI